MQYRMSCMAWPLYDVVVGVNLLYLLRDVVWFDEMKLFGRIGDGYDVLSVLWCEALLL